MNANVKELPMAVVIADLKRSGLTQADFKKLGLSALTSDQTFELTNKFKVRAIKFPYFDARGKDTGYFRLKLLDDTRGFGAAHNAKSLRYWQPPGTTPQAYFPLGIKWDTVQKCVDDEVWLTEGEKKAAAACKAGINCIGLGGVWSWRSTKSRQPLIPDLALIDWRDRPVKLCFDTEAEPKPLVVGALEMLGHILEQRGAKVSVVRLPLPDDEEDKIGLDDFLVANGKAALLELPTEGLASATALIKLNDELAVVDMPTAILHIPSKQLFSSPQSLIEMKYAHHVVPGVDAAGRMTEQSAVKAWLKWPGHRQVTSLAYEPGGERALPDGRFNLWSGWPVKPKRGNTALFDELLDYQFGQLSKDERQWLMQWFAYPLQNPGTKLYTALVLWSQDQGTGKTLLANTIGRIYGDAFSVITEAELHGSFNSWMANKQLILGEEITGSDRRIEANRLKHLITGETVEINRKYQVPYTLRNCTNFIFTTNDHDAFLLDAHDRRYFVHEVGSGHSKPDPKWFVKYDAWFRSEEATSAIFYKLMQIDLEGFNPRGKAPTTKSRNDMVMSTGSDADIIVREMLAAPDTFLKVGMTAVTRDLFTIVELMEMLDPTRRLNLKPRMLTNALRRAGVDAPDLTKTYAGVQRLWPVRNVAKWGKASHAERAQHYNDAWAQHYVDGSKPVKF